MDGASVQVAPDGTVIYRASALGSCTKELVALRMGYDEAPLPEKVAALFRSGHEAEERVHERMPLIARQSEVELVVTSKIRVVGHVDGISDSVDEVKSQSKDEWERFEKDGWETGWFPKYKWQASVYMHATGLPLRLIRIMRPPKELQDDPQAWAEAPIKTQVYFDPWYSLTEIRSRVLTVESQAAGGVLPVACDSLHYPCPVFYLHDDASDVEFGDEAVEVLAKQYQNAKLVEKIAKQKADETKVALRTKGTKMRTESGIKVTFFETGRLNDPVKRQPDEFWLENTWEQIRVTIPKERDAQRRSDTE